MEDSNSSAPFYFHLTLFEDMGSLRYLFFTLCLLLYMTIISANTGIVLTVYLQKSLHEPMFIFILCLSVNSLYGSSCFFPRFLMDLLSDSHVISRPACFVQLFVIYTYASCELTILSLMAYDRLVAICQPLHYHSRMSRRAVYSLLAFAWGYPLCSIGFCLYLTVRLPLCGNTVPRLYCTNWPVVHLSCVDTTINNIAGFFVTITTVLLPLVFVLYTYIRILLVCRRSSSEFRGKALQTCMPHIVTFVNYSISLFCEVTVSRYKSDELNPIIAVILSLEFLLIPSIVNPLVYGLNLPQIRGALRCVLQISKGSKQNKNIHTVI